MRKSILDALMPRTRQRLLAAVLSNPDRWWYMSDLAQHLEVAPSSLQRDLAALTDAGILERRREGNRAYFRPDAACPVLPELRGLLAKTAGLVDVLRDVLKPLMKGIRVAFVHGSVAQDRHGSGSDVDLIVIGEVGLAGLALPLREAQARIGREINVSVYRPAELESRSRAQGYLRKVLQRDLLFVLGSPGDLERLAGAEQDRRRVRSA